MAGSYSHATTDSGKFRSNESFVGMIENLGDAYEACEEMYGMIWFLAGGDAQRVTEAEQRYKDGIALSPGVQESR